MNPEILKERFKRFAIAVVRAIEKFPKETVYFIISKQLIRCSSSSAANYRAASRAKSGPDFIYKLKVVEEELDESLFWMEFTIGVDQQWESTFIRLQREGDELLSIVVASIRTARKKQYS